MCENFDEFYPFGYNKLYTLMLLATMVLKTYLKTFGSGMLDMGYSLILWSLDLLKYG